MIKLCSHIPEGKLEVGWQFSISKVFTTSMFYHKCEDAKWYAPSYAFRVKNVK